jgi:8-oxo-dGTP pyrophosphatase MutT (NUDIX family)
LRRSLPYEESYIGKLKALAGDQKLIVIATRAVVREHSGHVLFVKRRDNGKWVMPSGGLELDETLVECMIRETEEETGLTVTAARPMGIYTYFSRDPNISDQISVQFLVTEWTGVLQKETDETTDAAFFDPTSPPADVADHYHEVLRDVVDYQGQFIMKEPAGE